MFKLLDIKLHNIYCDICEFIESVFGFPPPFFVGMPVCNSNENTNRIKKCMQKWLDKKEAYAFDNGYGVFFNYKEESKEWFNIFCKKRYKIINNQVIFESKYDAEIYEITFK